MKKKNNSLKYCNSDNPLIKFNFKNRVNNYSGITLQGLNLAVSSGLLIRESNNNKILFQRSKKKWPANIKTQLPSDMIRAITRLAYWFYHMDTPTVYNLILEK
ncbi:three component ABC system middle component [Providencia stuartii]|uniref:three component ABC system middle component n=1 Tax=Providencia stuartii TaxID=588 RepID=UPI003D284B8D